MKKCGRSTSTSATILIPNSKSGLAPVIVDFEYFLSKVSKGRSEKNTRGLFPDKSSLVPFVWVIKHPQIYDLPCTAGTKRFNFESGSTTWLAGRLISFSKRSYLIPIHYRYIYILEIKHSHLKHVQFQWSQLSLLKCLHPENQCFCSCKFLLFFLFVGGIKECKHSSCF